MQIRNWSENCPKLRYFALPWGREAKGWGRVLSSRAGQGRLRAA